MFCPNLDIIISEFEPNPIFLLAYRLQQVARITKVSFTWTTRDKDAGFEIKVNLLSR